MKIFEAIGVMISTYMAGWLRQKTGGFNSVSIMLTFCALVAALSVYGMIKISLVDQFLLAKKDQEELPDSPAGDAEEKT